MKIKAIRMFDHGFMTQAFAFGGEDPKGTYDDQIIYRSSLQNFLIAIPSATALLWPKAKACTTCSMET